MPCSCASVHIAAESTEPPRCVCSSARPPRLTSSTSALASAIAENCKEANRLASALKVGIVVPYSWSYWGGVPEHADHQARCLFALGHEARLLMGHDPPGRLTKALHPRIGRHDRPPEYVLPVGRSVIVPANGSLPNLILTPA